MSAPELPEPSGQTGASRLLRPLPLAGLTVIVVLGAAMLRAPILAVAPIARLMEQNLGVGAATLGLLTSIPVLCFAVCSPLAIWVIRRGGADFAFTIAMGGSIIGCLIRSAGGVVPAIVGTAVIGAFVAVGNVVIPIIVAREYSPRRARTMTGIFTSSMNLGTFVATVGTAPAAALIGWQGALLLWAVFGLAALAVWLPLRGLRAAFRPASAARPADADDAPPVMRTPSTWLLAMAFAGQSFSFYAASAWLPSILSDQGYSASVAGAIAGIFQVCGMVGSLTTAFVITRVSVRFALILAGVFWLTVPFGFLFAPHMWVVWCVLGGVAQGAGLTIVFIMISGFGGGAHLIAGRSGVVQGLGYAVAATGPLLLGGLHQITGSWTLPLVVLLLGVLVFLGGGLGAARLLSRGVDVTSA